MTFATHDDNCSILWPNVVCLVMDALNACFYETRTMLFEYVVRCYFDLHLNPHFGLISGDFFLVAIFSRCFGNSLLIFECN